MSHERSKSASIPLVSVAVAEAVVSVIAAVAVLSEHTFAEDLNLVVTRLLALSVFLGAAAISTFTPWYGTYRIGIATHAVAAAWVIGLLQTSPVLQSLLGIAVVAYFSLAEPFPRSLEFSLATILVSVVIAWFQMSLPGYGTTIAIDPVFEANVIQRIVIATAVPVAAHFHERSVWAKEDRDHLEEVVSRLTRSNFEYQDFAIAAKRRGTEEERLRISRDVHDIVGYTLTNNIMLMEAALDIMQENALALPRLIKTARVNAEDGLSQIRQALYELRTAESERISGIRAIGRLASIFQESTRVTVRCTFAKLPSNLPEEIDHALYHLVQESLVNSYRHGRATLVTISFWYDGTTIKANVLDNGVGATVIDEGIGLEGLRERLVAVGGDYRITHRRDGFSAEAEIPWPQE